MAGFREFVTGEVLTAANVDDFLAKQAVMKFADAGARDTALGTAVASGNALREGMIAYLDDTDDVLKYDGSAWTTVGAVSYTLNVENANVETDQTFTQASYADLTSATLTVTPTSTSSRFLVLFTAHCNPTGSAQFQIKLQANGANVGEQGEIVPDASRDQMPALMRLHSPASTAAQTYKIQVRVANPATVIVKNSSLTVMEFRV